MPYSHPIKITRTCGYSPVACSPLQSNDNMHKFFALFFFCFIATHINAQVAKSFYLLNQKDSSKVPYATIKVLHTTGGTFSDEHGKFEVPVTADTLLISSIGF